MARPGRLNSLVDVAGLTVGHAHDIDLKSGVTVVLTDHPSVAGVHVMGGAPGTRETDLLAPEQTVDRINALVLSGGSVYGLDAAAGVEAFLREKGRGFAVGPILVPVVPAAILFDLLNGGNKSWGRFSPYRDLGYQAATLAVSSSFSLGSIGAGYGATTATLKGGLGTASEVLENGITVAALVAVNSVGSVTIGDTKHFWAAPFEIEAEFGGLGLPSPWPAGASVPQIKRASFQATEPGNTIPRANTTIAVVATDATLTKPDAKRLAIMAHDGLARAIYPAHTPIDGDLIFTLATGKIALTSPSEFMSLGIAGSTALARAVARAVFSATPAIGDLVPTWVASKWAGS